MQACSLCLYFFEPDDAPRGYNYQVGIGLVCDDCEVHAEKGLDALRCTHGIAQRCVDPRISQPNKPQP